jgi:hypothetical protein
VQQAPGTEVMPVVSHDRLLAMAEELGISPSALEAVLRDRQVQAEREQEQVTLAQHRKEFITHRRAGFMPHLYAYIGVNLLFIAIFLLSHSHYPWFIWPLLFWSLGLYFHAVFTLPTRGPNFDRAFSEWRERRIKRIEKATRDQEEETIRKRKNAARKEAEAELDE